MDIPTLPVEQPAAQAPAPEPPKNKVVEIPVNAPMTVREHLALAKAERHQRAFCAFHRCTPDSRFERDDFAKLLDSTLHDRL